jgi:hypothetical protein
MLENILTQTIKTNGRVTAISTPKGKANLFFTIFDSPPQKDRNGRLTGLNEMGFKTFSYGWWDVPTYNPYYDEYIASKNEAERHSWIEKAKDGDWYRAERPHHTDLSWRQEFEGAFDANKGTVFGTRSLERVFRRNYLKLIDDPDRLVTEWWSKNEDGGPDRYTEGEKAGKKMDRIYVTGIDLGRKGDPTIIETYDVTDFDPTVRDQWDRILDKAKMVDYKYIEAGTLEWSEIENVAKKHLKLWEPDSEHDGSGTGDSFSEAVYGYSEPFIFTKESKRNIVQTIQHAFDYGAVILPKIPRLYREHQKYEWDDDQIVQDTVMANGLAIHQFYDGGAEVMLGFQKVEFQ